MRESSNPCLLDGEGGDGKEAGCQGGVGWLVMVSGGVRVLVDGSSSVIDIQGLDDDDIEGRRFGAARCF